MVGWLGAVQSQEYGMAKWALGLRLPNLREADIEKAFNGGSILRTHVLRPTWHFVTPEDIRWMLELTKHRVHALNAPYYKKMELDSKLLKRCINIITKNLQREKMMDRFAIQSALQQSKILAEGLRLVLILMHAELEGFICSGPRKGKQFTYALLDEKAPAAKPLKHDEALHKLALRYFTSRAPATVHDFAWWSGLPIRDARDGATMLPTNFVHEGLYVVNTDVLPLPELARERNSFLMPDYDEYAMSYKDRDALFTLRDQKIFNRMIVVDGQVVGSWKLLKGLEIETSFLTKVTKVQQQLVAKAIKRYQKFLQ